MAPICTAWRGRTSARPVVLTFPVTLYALGLATRTYVTSPAPTFGSASTFNFAGTNLGTAIGTSLVVVVVHGWDTPGDGRKLSSASIAGVGATIHVNVVGTSAAVQDASCAIISATTVSASGTISLTFSAAVVACGIDVYRLNNLVSATPTATASNTTGSGTSLSTTINIPGNGVLIQGISLFANAVNPSLTGSGSTQDNEETVPGDADLAEWAGSLDTLPSQSKRTISGSFSTGAAALVGAAWN